MTTSRAEWKENGPAYLLRLYVIGATPASLRAIENAKAICDARLTGSFKLDIVDLRRQPEAAAEEEVVATPLIVKALPLPVRRVLGDLSDTKKVLLALGIEEDGA